MGVALLGLEWVVDRVSGAWWTYPLILAGTAVDAFFPVVPAETVIITAGVIAAADGGLHPLLIAPAAALGSLLGDNVSYAIGRVIGDPAARRLFRGERGRERLEWAKHMIERHGSVMVVAARFVPGGRTAITFSSGALCWRWRRFVAAAGIAAVLWASYATALGYLFGQTFRDRMLVALAVSLGVAVAVSLVGEAVRRARAPRAPARGGEGS